MILLAVFLLGFVAGTAWLGPVGGVMLGISAVIHVVAIAGAVGGK